MKKIYCLGSLSADITVNVDKFPQKGEQVKGYGLEGIPGGRAQNQAIAAKFYGADVKLLGAIGSDLYGEAIKKNLVKFGLSLDNIKVMPNETTDTKLVIRHNNDTETIMNSKLNETISEEDVDSFLDDAKKGDILLTQFELSLPVIKYAVKLANEKEMIIIINPSPATSDVVSLLPITNYLITNQKDMSLLTDEMEIEKASNSLNSLNTIVTLGEDGVYFVDEDVKFPALYPDQAIDTDAAGDIFIGAFASLIAQDKLPIEAVDFARGAASLSCLDKGGILSIKDTKEVLKAIDRDEI